MRLSQLLARNFRQFGDGANSLDIRFNGGITALVGRNDSGKSAVIDAIRYALLTRDQHYVKVRPEDFYIDETGDQADEIVIQCHLTALTDGEKGDFAEYLSYSGADATLFVNWTAKRRSNSPSARRWVDVSVRSGVNGVGPAFEASVRELLLSAYLRPLRDAARELSSGRGSRLSQVLANVPEIDRGERFDPGEPPPTSDAVAKLSLLGIADYLHDALKKHPGVAAAEASINEQYLAALFPKTDSLRAQIDLTESGSESLRLRRILERLELGLLEGSTDKARGSYGLGSNNLLYMACELLLLGREPDGLPLLLVEEPEAHLHPQRQLRLMSFLTNAAKGQVENSPRAVQVILSTHSPNLASSIPLENLVILEGARAFPLAEGLTKLEAGDYRFLERFLDVTKADLFFAHRVIVVEGDAEALLLPTLARLIGADLTEHGVTVINVGGTGLRRFSRIFQRRDDAAPEMSIPVACVADMDVMPDCAPQILGLVSGDDDPKWTNPTRRWRSKCDLGTDKPTVNMALKKRRQHLSASDGQSVRTFVADQWTLEYDLAFSGLAEEVYVAGTLAKNDRLIVELKKTVAGVTEDAKNEFRNIAHEEGSDRSRLCTRVYQILRSSDVSKAIAAQYLASNLGLQGEAEGFDRGAFIRKLPSYVVQAISYATGVQVDQAHGDGSGATEDADG
ncbi:MAG: AAA family ATPase [Sandaracinaceae bacterium]